MRKAFFSSSSASGHGSRRPLQESSSLNSRLELRSPEVKVATQGSTGPTLLHTDPATEKAAAISAPPPDASSSRGEAALADCLDLLRGPSDERRLAGLLLVTRLLPSVTVQELQQIYHAVGFIFINRLLLPLTPSTTLSNNGSTEHSVSPVDSSVLALTLLASFVRIPGFANNPSVLSRTPVYSKVVLAGGAASILNADATSAEDRQADLISLESSLEIGSAVAETNAAIAVQSGSIRAASKCLVRCVPQHMELAPAALRLLSASLVPRLPESFSEGNGDALLTVLPALAAILAAPAGSRPADPSAPAPATARDIPAGALTMQLDALRILLLILPVPLPQGAVLQGRLEREAEGRGRWLESLRDGLHQLLRSRTGPAQRHGALQLAAALTGLAGSSWLLGSSKENPAGSFLQLLVGLLKVELHLALLDALEPTAPVPSIDSPVDVPEVSHPHKNATSLSPGGDRDADDDVEDVEALDEDAPAAAEIGIMTGVRNLSFEGDQKPASSTQSGGDGSTSLPDTSSADAGKGTQTAGERAQQLLPPVLELVEGCIDALAEDCDAAEAVANGQYIDHATLQVFSEKQAGDLGASLLEAADTLLQFLEAKAEQPSGLADPLCLAVTRCLGRFLADAPTAHSERVQSLLPQLLSMHDGAALSFLGPALSQLADPQPGDHTSAEWQKLLRTPQVMDALLSHLAHLSGEARQAWHAAADMDVSKEGDANRSMALDAENQLQCIGSLMVDLLDDRKPSESQASASEGRMSAALSALCGWSVVSRAPARTLNGQEQEIKLRVLLGLVAARLLSTLHAQEAGLQPSSVQAASTMLVDALQTGDAFRLIQAAHLRASASSSSLEEVQQQQEGTSEQGELPIDVHWEALLQCATLLGEQLPQFATVAAKCRWVKQLHSTAPTDKEAVEEMELRLFAQTVLRNANGSASP